MPTITGTPTAIYSDTDSNSATAAVSWIDPTASDNSGDVTLTSDATSGSNFPIGTNTVTFNATDPSGNQATDSFTIIVSDAEMPTITGTPTAIYSNTDANSATAAVSWIDPTASDNSGDVTLTSDATSGSNFPIGTNTVTFNATDPSGNQATDSFTIIVTDAEMPTITGTPTAIYSNTDSNSATAAVSWIDPTASDNSGDVTLTSDATSGSNFPIGTNTVTFNATDPSGNQATDSFTIIVSDAEMPTITGTPTAIYSNTDANSATAAVSWIDPTASDNSGDVTLTSDATSGSNFPIGTNTVTFNATDPSGNQATDSFTITVTDAEIPTITGTPTAIYSNTDSNSATAAVSWVDPSASDNSGHVTLTSDATSGSNFPIGTNTVTFNATDPSGNQATDSFTIIVTDNEDPTFDGTVSNITANTDMNQSYAIVTWSEPTASDNSGSVTLTTDYNPGDEFSIGNTYVTYTATDPSGNSAALSFTVTVNGPF
ncbi:hyalin-like [Amphiura filiformis]|uniref:hyalin-like n=1 Tax=Amphiura filiformis TaxID=82378 RepID=UPI003B20F827